MAPRKRTTVHTPIRLLRRARTLTQYDMARLLGITQATYSRYESGKLLPDIYTRARIVLLLGGDLAELFPPPEQKEEKAS